MISEDVWIEVYGDETVRIVVNDNIRMSDKKLAAQAVHAALYAYGIPHGRVVVLGGSKSKVEALPVVIRDAGPTELPSGTVTAGAVIEPAARKGRSPRSGKAGASETEGANGAPSRQW